MYKTANELWQEIIKLEAHSIQYVGVNEYFFISSVQDTGNKNDIISFVGNDLRLTREDISAVFWLLQENQKLNLKNDFTWLSYKNKKLPLLLFSILHELLKEQFEVNFLKHVPVLTVKQDNIKMEKPIIVTDRKQLNPLTEGLKPIVNENTKILILGTFPSQSSITAGYYYQNQIKRFWGQALHSIDNMLEHATNEERITTLLNNGVGLWDIFECIERAGISNQDKGIRKAKYNNFESFLDNYPSIQYLVFNGKTNTFGWFIDDNPDILIRPNLILKPLQSSSGSNPNFKYGKEWNHFFNSIGF